MSGHPRIQSDRGFFWPELVLWPAVKPWSLTFVRKLLKVFAPCRYVRKAPWRDLHRLLLETALPLELVLTRPPPDTTEPSASSAANVTPSGNTWSSNMCANLNQILVMLHISHIVEWSPCLPAQEISNMHFRSFLMSSFSELVGTCLSRINWIFICH